jgi:hypothetical protein
MVTDEWRRCGEPEERREGPLPPHGTPFLAPCTRTWCGRPAGDDAGHTFGPSPRRADVAPKLRRGCFRGIDVPLREAGTRTGLFSRVDGACADPGGDGLLP